MGKQNYCVDCGAEIGRGSTRCYSCTTKHHWEAGVFDHLRDEPNRCIDCGAEIHRRSTRCVSCNRHRWARDWDRCQECGTIETPHQGYGLCEQCYNRKYREEHHAELLCAKQQYYCDNRERALARTRHNYCENHEERLAYAAGYREQHREEYKEYFREYGRGHRNEKNEYRRQWRKDNREQARTQGRKYSRCRRARLMNAAIEEVDEAIIYELYSNTCVYCGSKEDLTLDHIVPLAGGGAHCEDNLAVACKTCNCSKGAKPLIKWMADGGWWQPKGVEYGAQEKRF